MVLKIGTDIPMDIPMYILKIEISKLHELYRDKILICLGYYETMFDEVTFNLSLRWIMTVRNAI